jgi:hypothetical protein
MVVVRLLGGLGNQMFQYACGRAVAARAGSRLLLDTSDIALSTPAVRRRHQLHVFNIKAKPVSSEVMERLFELPKNLYQWQEWIESGGKRPPMSRLVERYFHFDPAILHAGDNVYLDGFFQSEKYFLDQVEIIRRDFTLRLGLEFRMNRDLLPQVEQCESVSIHVRRGDYASDKKTNQFHGLCPPEYYRRCLEHVAAQVRNPVFFLFSDEPDWVRENLHLSQPVTLVSNGRLKDYEELRLMSLCRHHIIANSSFSWWGAWLDPRPDKIVCAPEHWFADKLINTSDLIPEGWIRF